MNHAAFVGVRQAGANLFEIEQRAFNRQGIIPRERRHVSARQVFQNQVVKRRAIKIDGRAVSETADNIWMPNAIKSYGFVLIVGYERPLEIVVRCFLQEKIERFNDYGL